MMFVKRATRFLSVAGSAYLAVGILLAFGIEKEMDIDRMGVLGIVEADFSWKFWLRAGLWPVYAAGLIGVLPVVNFEGPAYAVIVRHNFKEIEVIPGVEDGCLALSRTEVEWAATGWASIRDYPPINEGLVDYDWEEGYIWIADDAALYGKTIFDGRDGAPLLSEYSYLDFKGERCHQTRRIIEEISDVEEVEEFLWTVLADHVR